MLAKSFLTYKELGITEREHQAFITLLGMLERGEITHEFDASCYGREKMFFNMNDPYRPKYTTLGYRCGTVACIGGWAAHLMGLGDPHGYVNGGYGSSRLRTLFFPTIEVPDASYDEITTEQAAQALRNYLTRGGAHWAEILSDEQA